MNDLDGLTLGERVAELRRRRGLSQKDLAAEVRRSESWVSQVERGVQPVERLSVLQILADALGAPVQALRPEAAGTQPAEPPETPARTPDLDGLRLVLTGHPALPALFSRRTKKWLDLDALHSAVEDAWELAHASRYKELTKTLAELLPKLETAARQSPEDARPKIYQHLARTYQAVAAAFARQDEEDAAWVAADRAIIAAELSSQPLNVLAGHFRMAHAFMGLRRNDQAERVALSAVDALRSRVRQSSSSPEELSLFGAMHLVLAVIYGREGQRAKARESISGARHVAARLGEDRNHFNTEFGPTNVEIHAVSVAVELGDAGEALEIAQRVNAGHLSPERKARFLLDVARAHTQRRHVGDAIAALLEAERLTPEMIQSHSIARETIRELIQLAGRRAPQELTDLARRAAALS